MTLVTSGLLGRRSRLSNVLLGMSRLSSVLLGVNRLFLMVSMLLYFTLVLFMSSLKCNVLLWVSGLFSSGMLLRMSRLLGMGLLGRSLFNRALILN